VKQSRQRGQPIVDVAMAAGDTVMSALTELKSLAVAIQDAPRTYTGATADGFGEAGKKLVADFEAIVKEIHSSLAGATFDGVNLFKTGTNVTVTTGTSSTSTFTLKGSTDAAAAASFGFGGTVDAAAGTWTVGADFTAKSGGYTVANVDTAINAFTKVMADLGTKSKSLDRQVTFTSKM